MSRSARKSRRPDPTARPAPRLAEAQGFQPSAHPAKLARCKAANVAAHRALQKAARRARLVDRILQVDPGVEWCE